MKLQFEVGDVHKRQIEFSWNQMWGTMRLKLDGKLFAKSGITPASPSVLFGRFIAPEEDRWALGPMEILLVQRWMLEIKEPEKHFVVIEKRRERWLAGLRP